jgi:4-amino-4-deoxy-L-arabinose transferase-like glycosyltransferase
MKKDAQSTPAAESPAGASVLSAGISRREKLALAAILLAALGLRVWALGQNAYGNEYYSAGVRSMLESWHNFLFNAFDPAGFLSLDKPPVAFWIQAGSAKLLGFSGLSVLLPQVVEGLAAILLLFHLVRRRFGTLAGLLGALFLALTPISVAVDRSTNTESCLVLVLLLAGWALSVAAERSWWWMLALAMALLGVGFNVKMLAALVVAPAFLLVYLLGARLSRREQWVHAVIAMVTLGAVSLSWSLAYDLTPAQDRPFAGSSRENSMIELALDHNGLQRFVRIGRRALRAAGVDSQQAAPVPPGTAVDPTAPPPAASVTLPRNRLENVPAGPLRLAAPYLAGQIGWLFPLAAFALLAAIPWRKPDLPVSPRAQALLLWGGWALSYGAIFSGAGGIFHAYYLVTMAAPLAALAGIAAAELWEHHRARGWRVLIMPAGLLATAAWQYVVGAGFPGVVQSEWWRWLSAALLVGAAVASVGLLLPVDPKRRVAERAAALALVAVLLLPTTWALSSVVIPGHVEFPVAGAWQPTPAEDPMILGARLQQVEALLTFLRGNRHGERFLVATPDARYAAPLIIASGEPVMAMGGYMGGDAILTADMLAGMAERGELRFVMIATRDDPQQRVGRSTVLADWVRQNGTLVDPAQWRTAVEDPPPGDDGQAGPRRGRRSRRALASLELYDISPRHPGISLRSE